MEHGAVDDAARQVRRIAAAGEMLDRIAQDAPLAVESHLPVAAEIVALAGEDEIVVAIEPQLAGPPRDLRGKGRDGRPLRRLALLAAEAAAHAADLAGDIGVRDAEHAGDDMLHLGRMLRRGIDVDVAVLARDREGDLALEIEMLLPADAELARERMRRRARWRRTASPRPKA